MAAEQKGEGSGFWLPAILIAGAGIWWWNSSTDEPPPPVFVRPAPATPPVAASSPATTRVQPPPAPNYDFVEGDTYGYITALSDEERSKGRATGEVVMYRYAGFWGGEYHLETIEGDGTVVGRSSCAKPCVAIKSNYSGLVRRVAYSPKSVIGAAMEDAMAGRLRKIKEPPRREPVAEPSLMAPADPVPAQPEADGPTT